MTQLSRALVCFCAALIAATFATQSSAQLLTSPPPVYVSGGTTIYVQNGTGFTPVLTVANANFESLAIGPDNVDVDGSGNAKYAFFLYACDPAGTIIRIGFTPALSSTALPTVAGTETVYNASVSLPGLAPVCGRSSSAGDFYITNKSGPGVFVFSGIANVPFGSSSLPFSPAPVALSNVPKKMTGRGITQKYVGDLLIVDNFDSQVLRSPYAVPFASLSTFINSNLNGPVGISTTLTTTPSASGVFAANSNFFVANSNSSQILAQQPPVSVFTFDDTTQTGVPASPCPALTFPSKKSSGTADYLASAPTADSTKTVINNTIYLVTNSSHAGTLWTWNTAQAQGAQPNCNLSFAASIGTALSGLAVAPAPVTLELAVSSPNASVATPTPTTFNFNSNLFQLTATGCTASVTAYPRSLATVNSMIKLAEAPGGDTNASPPYPASLIPPPLVNPAKPAANLGDGGFEIAYVAHWLFPSPTPSCTSVFGDGGFKTGISNFVDSSQSNNPRAVQCDNSDPTTEPQLFPPSVATTCGAPEPIGVYPLGGPISGDLHLTSNSLFAMVNENSGTSTAEPGTFCGFQQPLVNTLDPSQAASFSAGTTTTVNVKFKLSAPAGNCKKDFITDAVALISVAKILNPDLTTTFSAINVQPTSSSLDQPPLFNGGNQQYSFTLNLPSIFAQAGAGFYSLTVTFFTDNTTNQTILFQLTQ